MITEKEWVKINRLRKRKGILENKIIRIRDAIDKVNNKLFDLIVRKN